jgi:hypothetical protein
MDCICLIISFSAHVTYDSLQYDLCIWIIHIVLVSNAGLTMLSNLTHVRIKRAMHINETLRERCSSVPVTAY